MKINFIKEIQSISFNQIDCGISISFDKCGIN